MDWESKKDLIEEIIGWYGTLAILIAYGLVNFDLLTTKSLIYQLLNLTGAISIVYISFDKKNIQPAVLNIIWALIGLISIVKLIF